MKLIIWAICTYLQWWAKDSLKLILSCVYIYTHTRELVIFVLELISLSTFYREKYKYIYIYTFYIIKYKSFII